MEAVSAWSNRPVAAHRMTPALISSPRWARPAMQHDGARFGRRQQGFIEAEAGEGPAPVAVVLLLASSPDIGVRGRWAPHNGATGSVVQLQAATPAARALACFQLRLNQGWKPSWRGPIRTLTPSRARRAAAVGHGFCCHRPRRQAQAIEAAEGIFGVKKSARAWPGDRCHGPR